MDEQLDIVKLIILGTANVGKSSILLRYCDDEYQEEGFSTVGLDMRSKEMKREGRIVRLQIWDTAGQERYKTMVSHQYKGAKIVLFVYDITKEDSFEYMQKTYDDFISNAGAGATIAFVGNKLDLQDQRVIQLERAQEISNKYNALYFEVSSKTGEGVKEMFESVVEAYYNKKPLQGEKIESQILQNRQQKPQSKCTC